MGSKRHYPIMSEASNSFETAVITDGSDAQATKIYYNKWSEQYENDMVISNYNGPKHVVEAFLDLNLDKNTRILDVLAGSGLVAKLLSPHGYTNIDAIDGSEDMLSLAKKEESYKNFYVSLLGGEHVAPIEAETYDAVIASGTFAPGHLYSDAFLDLIRMTKKGGVIAWSMRNDYAKSSPKFVNFDQDIDSLVSQKVWSYYRPRKDVEQYLLGSDGYVYIMQKL